MDPHRAAGLSRWRARTNRSALDESGTNTTEIIRVRIFESQDNVAAARARQKNRVKSQRVTPAEFFAAQKARERPKRVKKRAFDPDRVPLEHQEQATLIKWKLLYQRQIPELECLFAIPNQGAARLKNLQTEGVLKGVSDLFLAVPVVKADRLRWAVHAYAGLFIELKRVKGGKVSAEQYAFLARMKFRGYEAIVCYGAEDAWQTILKYLGVKDPR